LSASRNGRKRHQPQKGSNFEVISHFAPDRSVIREPDGLFAA
jgi:hypothetical protein